MPRKERKPVSAQVGAGSKQGRFTLSTYKSAGSAEFEDVPCSVRASRVARQAEKLRNEGRNPKVFERGAYVSLDELRLRAFPQS